MKIVSFVILLIFSFIGCLSAQVWKPYGAGLLPNQVYDFIEYNGQLVAGGPFNGSDTVLFRGIARWDGTNWTTFGGGSTGSVYTLIEYNGDLVAAGNFSAMGSTPSTKGIARWNGTSWLPLGAGLTNNGTIRCMAVYNGKLYVAGNFQGIGGFNINTIASWDGNSWDTVCNFSSAGYFIFAMTVFNNELYIGGFFGNVNSTPNTYNIAKYDGVSWSSVGGAVNSDVFALYADTINNRLYAGGNFSYAGGGMVYCPSNVAYWDGSNWNAFGATTSNLWPRSISIFKSEVYAGFSGAKVNSNGDTLYGIARFDGSDWQPLGKGLRYGLIGSSAHALFTFNNNLAVGGAFTFAGDTAANRVASWDYTPVGISELESENKQVLIYPNPFRNTATVKLPDYFTDKMPLIFELHNINGKLVLERKIRSQAFEISRDSLTAGVYIYQLRNRKKILSSGKVVIE